MQSSYKAVVLYTVMPPALDAVPPPFVSIQYTPPYTLRQFVIVVFRLYAPEWVGANICNRHRTLLPIHRFIDAAIATPAVPVIRTAYSGADAVLILVKAHCVKLMFVDVVKIISAFVE